jgi:hypothetical protein
MVGIDSDAAWFYAEPYRALPVRGEWIGSDDV